MKIEAHITAVTDHGDRLKIEAQGRASNSADWQPYLSAEIYVLASDRAKKTYYLGRGLDLFIEPRR